MRAYTLVRAGSPALRAGDVHAHMRASASELPAKTANDSDRCQICEVYRRADAVSVSAFALNPGALVSLAKRLLAKLAKLAHSIASEASEASEASASSILNMQVLTLRIALWWRREAGGG